MTREEARSILRNAAWLGTNEKREKIESAVEFLCGEPCDDAISRQTALNVADYADYTGLAVEDVKKVTDAVVKELKCLPPVTPKQTIEREFAKWVAEEIFDDNWEYNYGAFAELACRKLAKLGIVRAKGDEWELVESEDKHGISH